MLITQYAPQTEIQYPDSDGQPMAESDFQRVPLIYAVQALDAHLAANPQVYVSANIFLYYVEGHPEKVAAPDVFVAFGVEKRERKSYKIWEEGKAPDFILEITSESTRDVDQGPKRGLYAYLGVREYWLYDPSGAYLNPPLQGWQLQEDTYVRIRVEKQVGFLTGVSHVLGLELRCLTQAQEFRFFDPVANAYLPSYQEMTIRAAQAQAEIERLRVQVEQLRQP